MEVFNRDSEDAKVKPVEALISRNQTGEIIYVVPGSTKVLVNRWFPGLDEEHVGQIGEIFSDKQE